LSLTQKTDWNPETYARFRGLRLRPALDLLAQVQGLPEGDIIDLGCGSGTVGTDLKLRFPDEDLIGVDQSATMLVEAQTLQLYQGLDQADIGLWGPVRPPALIFSNAALHWLPDHAALLPRLAGMLAPGGVLAVQMPRQYFAPSHRFLRDIAAALYPDRFDFARYEAPVQAPQGYWQMLQGLGEVQAWETEYLQRLDPVADMHPVHAFTQSTAMRPFLAKMTDAEAAPFAAAYDQALTSAYPLLPDGSCLMPFRRVFFTLKV
jgi:trans-aconitate 2-methyltransferase